MSDPTTRTVTLVAALADNGVIGHEGGIPWRIPADFAHFKETTSGHPLILGRTTFEGIGSPLPDRQSIVLTSDPEWRYDGVLVARDIEEALELADSVADRWGSEVMVGGGAAVYAAALPHATHQILTLVHAEPEGDTHYPDFDRSLWRETRREDRGTEPVPWEIVWLEREA